MAETSTCAKCGKVVGDNELSSCPHGPDPEFVTIYDGPPKRFPRVVAEPVERRTRVTWCVGGREVLHDRGDGTYEVACWPHATIEDLERLFYVIGELLSITNPTESTKGN